VVGNVPEPSVLSCPVLYKITQVRFHLGAWQGWEPTCCKSVVCGVWGVRVTGEQVCVRMLIEWWPGGGGHEWSSPPEKEMAPETNPVRFQLLW